MLGRPRCRGSRRSRARVVAVGAGTVGDEGLHCSAGYYPEDLGLASPASPENVQHLASRVKSGLLRKVGLGQIQKALRTAKSSVTASAL
mgnify:CR=1 FL=1